MQYEYDKEVDGLYIWFVDDIEKEGVCYGGEVWPKELKDEIGLLFQKDGKLLGLEVLFASKYFHQEKLDEIGKESYKDWKFLYYAGKSWLDFIINLVGADTCHVVCTNRNLFMKIPRGLIFNIFENVLSRIVLR